MPECWIWSNCCFFFILFNAFLIFVAASRAFLLKWTMNVEHWIHIGLHFRFVQYKRSNDERNGIFTFNFPTFRSVSFGCWLFYFNNFISHLSVFHLIQSSYKQPNQVTDALECLARFVSFYYNFVYDDREFENQEKPLFALCWYVCGMKKKKNCKMTIII